MAYTTPIKAKKTHRTMIHLLQEHSLPASYKLSLGPNTICRNKLRSIDGALIF